MKCQPLAGVCAALKPSVLRGIAGRVAGRSSEHGRAMQSVSSTIAIAIKGITQAAHRAGAHLTATPVHGSAHFAPQRISCLCLLIHVFFSFRSASGRPRPCVLAVLKKQNGCGRPTYIASSHPSWGSLAARCGASMVAVGAQHSAPPLPPAGAAAAGFAADGGGGAAATAAAARTSGRPSQMGSGSRPAGGGSSSTQAGLVLPQAGTRGSTAGTQQHCCCSGGCRRPCRCPSRSAGTACPSPGGLTIGGSRRHAGGCGGGCQACIRCTRR